MYVESITLQLPTRLSGVAVKPTSIFSNLLRHSSTVSPRGGSRPKLKGGGQLGDGAPKTQ